MAQLERYSVKTFAYNAYDLSGGATIKLNQKVHGSLAGRRIVGGMGIRAQGPKVVKWLYFEGMMMSRRFPFL